MSCLLWSPSIGISVFFSFASMLMCVRYPWSKLFCFPQAIPVDEPISRLVGPSRDLDRVWSIPDFDFQHSFVLLPTPEELRAATLAEQGGGGEQEQELMMAGEIRGESRNEFARQEGRSFECMEKGGEGANDGG